MKKLIVFFIIILSFSVGYSLTNQELFYSKCTTCHGAKIIKNKRYTKKKWAKTVKRMKSHGANMNRGEMKRIVTYLTNHFGK